MRIRYLSLLLVLFLFSSCTSFANRKSLAEEYYNIGNAFYDLGMTEKAVDYYMKAINFNPRLKDANYNLARAYLEIEQWKSGLLILEELKELDPENTLILETMAYANYKKGDEQKAIELYVSVLDFNEYDQTALYNLAIIYRNKAGDDVVSGEAKTESPEDGSILGGLPEETNDAAVSEDNQADGIVDEESSAVGGVDTVQLDNNGTESEASATANAQEQEGAETPANQIDDKSLADEPEEDYLAIALGYLEKAYEYNPRKEVLRELGSLHAQLEHPEEAIRYYEEYLDVAPEDLKTALVCVDLYISQKQYYNAMERYDELLETAETENKPLILFEKGRVMAVLVKDYQDGLMILEEALEAGFEDKDAVSALIDEAGDDLRLSLVELFTEYELYP